MAAKVTVRSAARERPRRSPVSPSTPLGRSTASTGAAPTFGASHVPLKPVPNAASITRSAGGSRAGHVATSNTRTVHPVGAQALRRGATVIAVVPLAGDHVHDPPVGATEHAAGRPRRLPRQLAR